MKILALIGGSGSGKSTVLDGLRNHFGERAAVLSLDNYYRPKSELPVDEIVRQSLEVAAEIDIYTNTNITVEQIIDPSESNR